MVIVLTRLSGGGKLGIEVTEGTAASPCALVKGIDNNRNVSDGNDTEVGEWGCGVKLTNFILVLSVESP